MRSLSVRDLPHYSVSYNEKQSEEAHTTLGRIGDTSLSLRCWEPRSSYSGHQLQCSMDRIFDSAPENQWELSWSGDISGELWVEPFRSSKLQSDWDPSEVPPVTAWSIGRCGPTPSPCSLGCRLLLNVWPMTFLFRKDTFKHFRSQKVFSRTKK